jgi:hypothetical protein
VFSNSNTSTGILLTAGGNDINITANATVSTPFLGIQILDGNNTLGIAGEVTAPNPIQIVGANNTLNVLAGGSITGGNFGVNIPAAGGNSVTIAGRITAWSGFGLNVDGGSNVVTVTNTGHVFGGVGVQLGSGVANQAINNGVVESSGGDGILFAGTRFVRE